MRERYKIRFFRIKFDGSEDILTMSTSFIPAVGEFYNIFGVRYHALRVEHFISGPANDNPHIVEVQLKEVPYV